MSRGQWANGVRNEKAAKMIRQLREKAAQEREHSNEKVLDAIEKHGALSVEQLVGKTGLAKSSVHNALDRLRREGEVKRLDERRRVGQHGIPAYLYDIGIEDDDMRRKPVQVIIRRDPLVEAFYGPYEREVA